MKVYEMLCTPAARGTLLPVMAAFAVQLTGCAAFGLGRTTDASPARATDEQALMAAVERNPGDADAHDALGKHYAQSGREALALREFQLAASRAPDYSRVLNNLGYQLLRTGQPAQAVEVLRRALALDPLNPVARVNLSLASQAAEVPVVGVAPQTPPPTRAEVLPAQGAALVQVSEGVWQLKAPPAPAGDTLAGVRPQPRPDALALRMTGALTRAHRPAAQTRVARAPRSPLKLALTARLAEPTL